MNGVVVLNEFEAVVGHTFGFNWISLFICLVGVWFLIMDLFFNLKERKRGNKISLISSSTAALAFLFIFCGLLGFNLAEEVVETHYEIYMPGEVNMVEFTQHYEIVDQRGFIYTVRDLTDNEVEEGP